MQGNSEFILSVQFSPEWQGLLTFREICKMFVHYLLFQLQVAESHLSYSKPKRKNIGHLRISLTSGTIESGLRLQKRVIRACSLPFGFAYAGFLVLVFGHGELLQGMERKPLAFEAFILMDHDPECSIVLLGSGIYPLDKSLRQGTTDHD